MMKSQSSSSASTPMLFTPFSMAKIGAALNKRGVYLSVYCLIIAALWNTHSVLAAPAKIDLQPPIFEPSAAALQAPGASDNTATTKDSYGNPIGSLKPIDTPDGRKVVSAQGLQFEIPNYASGITEIKKPSDDLLPPFIASFEPNTSSTTSTTTTNADKKVPLSADRESFPPFNNVITGSSTLPSKTTFTKSEDGKVITNNIFLSGGLGSTSVKPFGFTTSEKNTVDKSTTASSVFKQFGTTSSAAAGFVTNADTSASFGAKYTGRFGGPPGVLAPQNNGFNTASTTVTKTTISSHPSATTAIAFTTGSNNYKFTGSFGGPPGVLKPFDNVKTG